MAEDTRDTFRFGVFELDPRHEALLRRGNRVPLKPQAYKVLLLLVSRAGSPVTRSEIEKAIWNGSCEVDVEQGINRCVKEIRQALDDDPKSPRFLETIPGTGYRFLADVKVVPPGSAVAGAPEISHQEAGSGAPHHLNGPESQRQTEETVPGRGPSEGQRLRRSRAFVVALAFLVPAAAAVWYYRSVQPLPPEKPPIGRVFARATAEGRRPLLIPLGDAAVNVAIHPDGARTLRGDQARNAGQWIAQQRRFPPSGSLEEYAFYAEECYPRAAARKQCFDRYCRGAQPSVGYRMLALLAKAEMIKAIWTTNFAVWPSRLQRLSPLTCGKSHWTPHDAFGRPSGHENSCTFRYMGTIATIRSRIYR